MSNVPINVPMKLSKDMVEVAKLCVSYEATRQRARREGAQYAEEVKRAQGRLQSALSLEETAAIYVREYGATLRDLVAAAGGADSDVHRALEAATGGEGDGYDAVARRLLELAEELGVPVALAQRPAAPEDAIPKNKYSEGGNGGI